MEQSLRSFFENIHSSAGRYKEPVGADFKKALDGLDAEEKSRFLLMPLSETVQENCLSFIIADGFVENDHYSGAGQWRIDFLTTALDEIEKLTQDRDKRIALLTDANGLGQTPFLKTLTHEHGNADIFEILTERLYKWVGFDIANPWMRSFLEQPPAVTESIDNEDDPYRGKHKPTPIIYAFPGEMFFMLLDQCLEPKTPQQLADYILEQLSQRDTDGNTLMHRKWQRTPDLDFADSADDVEDSLATVIACYDLRLLPTETIDLTSKLLSLKNNKGEMPLDRLFNKEQPERDYYIDAFLLNLRKKLGEQEMFESIVMKAIAPVLPADFSRELSSYDPERIPKPGAEPAKQRGATFKP